MTTSISRPSVASSRRTSSTSATMIVGTIIVAILCLSSITVVESMVVTTPKPKTASTSTSTSTSSSTDTVVSHEKETPELGSVDALRRLLEESNTNNYGSKSPPASSYSFDFGTDTAKEGGGGVGKPKKTSPLLDPWRDYEVLRPTNLEDEILRPFFFESGLKRQTIIASRFYQVGTTLLKAKEDWEKAQASGADSANDEISLKAKEGDDPAALALCNAVASLGPLAVKLGQTLSQRPDIVGRAAADALKRLQTQNTPFADDLAYAVMRESLDYWDGPLAGNLPDEDWIGNSDGGNTNTKPLFRELSKEPIASASLGQVYKATTWEGVDIALKVQRPDALSVIAVDAQCFRVGFAARNELFDLRYQWNALLGIGNQDAASAEKHTPETGMTEDEVRSSGDEGTVSSVIDRVAKDIKREMDYKVEAANSYKFRDSLSFLGFVDTPDVLLATDKILATKFIRGHHLAAIQNPRDELAMTRMAVEACTASMVLTGFVHADPHEGNLMYREEDGRVVFLDFGLMSDVDETIMEAFAAGIQALLSEDFVGVTEAFSDTGFVTTPIMHRNTLDDLWKVDPEFGLPELSRDLETAMRTTDGGMSRFGALATVLNKKISPNWLVFTPPYVLLLIRTFLTLEGIAAQVDPDFNIYEMSLPWVVRRSLSPSTEKGRNVLRNTILKKDNKIQWERVMDLMEMQKMAATASDEFEDASVTVGVAVATEETSSPATTTTTTGKEEKAPTVAAATTREEKARKQKEFAAQQQGAMRDAVGTLLGSTNGRALRGVLKDLDTPDLIWKLGSKEGRPILKSGTEKALNKLFGGGSTNNAASATASTDSDSGRPTDAENYRPVSEECQRLREKQRMRTKQVTRFLIKRQLRRCLLSAKGITGLVRLAVSALRIAAPMLLQKLVSGLRLTKHHRRAAPAVE